jgi:hypothetical protein
MLPPDGWSGKPDRKDSLSRRRENQTVSELSLLGCKDPSLRLPGWASEFMNYFKEFCADGKKKDLSGRTIGSFSGIFSFSVIVFRTS